MKNELLTPPLDLNVTPAQAGVNRAASRMDSGLRRNDGNRNELLAPTPTRHSRAGGNLKYPNPLHAFHQQNEVLAPRLCLTVTPAQAGVHLAVPTMDSGLRRNDETWNELLAPPPFVILSATKDLPRQNPKNPQNELVRKSWERTISPPCFPRLTPPILSHLQSEKET